MLFCHVEMKHIPKAFFCLVNRQVVDEHTGAPMNGKAGGSSVVLLMVRDAYANYVVQTTLDVVPEGEEKRLLLEELNAHSAELVSLMAQLTV